MSEHKHPPKWNVDINVSDGYEPGLTRYSKVADGDEDGTEEYIVVDNVRYTFGLPALVSAASELETVVFISRRLCYFISTSRLPDGTIESEMYGSGSGQIVKVFAPWLRFLCWARGEE